MLTLTARSERRTPTAYLIRNPTLPAHLVSELRTHRVAKVRKHAHQVAAERADVPFDPLDLLQARDSASRLIGLRHVDPRTVTDKQWKQLLEDRDATVRNLAAELAPK